MWIRGSEDVNERIENNQYFYSVFASEDMPNLQRQSPELAEIIPYLNTGDLPVSDKCATKIIVIADQFTVHDGII